MTSRIDVYQSAGRALEIAQLFETELGTALLAFDALETQSILNPDIDAYLRLRKETEGLTLGLLLKRIKKRLSLDENIEILYQEALDARNFLAHHLFKRNVLAILDADGCNKLLAEIEAVSEKLSPAYTSAQRLSGVLVHRIMALDNGTGA